MGKTAISVPITYKPQRLILPRATTRPHTLEWGASSWRGLWPGRWSPWPPRGVQAVVDLLEGRGRGKERTAPPLPETAPPKLPSVLPCCPKPTFLPSSGQEEWHWEQVMVTQSLLTSGLGKGLSVRGGTVTAEQRSADSVHSFPARWDCLYRSPSPVAAPSAFVSFLPLRLSTLPLSPSHWRVFPS